MRNKNVIIEARKFALSKILEYSEDVTYHDFKFAKKYIELVKKIAKNAGFNESELNLITISGWLVTASFEDFIVHFDENKQPVSNLSEEVIKTLNEFKKIVTLPDEDYTVIEEALRNIDLLNPSQSKFSMVLADAITASIVKGNFKKNFKKMYEELILKDVNISKKKWLDIALQMSETFSFNLQCCKDEFAPMLQELQKELLKEKKQLDKTTDEALIKQLSISDQELKKLKKNLNESKGRDARGIQTMFRTTSRNHYTLNQMVDRKASIMITVNSIILSLVIGGIIRPDLSANFVSFNWSVIPIIIILLMAVFSMIFAILSIRPEITHGRFTEEDVRNKDGNLLYYGNFHSMRYRDYEWGFLQMMTDQDYLYRNMIKDIYFLGKSLKVKFKLIRMSLTIFLFGVIAAVCSFLIIHFFINPIHSL